LPWTPYIEFAAFATGVAAGAIVFAGSTDPAILGPSEVFRAGGTWDMSFADFWHGSPIPFATTCPHLFSSAGTSF
jgi:hypothetical protein